MARFCRYAFPGGNPWQLFHSMYPKRGLGRENHLFLARFARCISKTRWFCQDMRAMHPGSPANSRSRMHCAKILPGRGPFRCTNPSNHARWASLAMPRRRRAPPGPKGQRSRTDEHLQATAAHGAGGASSMPEACLRCRHTAYRAGGLPPSRPLAAPAVAFNDRGPQAAGAVRSYRIRTLSFSL